MLAIPLELSVWLMAVTRRGTTYVFSMCIGTNALEKAEVLLPDAALTSRLRPRYLEVAAAVEYEDIMGLISYLSSTPSKSAIVVISLRFV